MICVACWLQFTENQEVEGQKGAMEGGGGGGVFFMADAAIAANYPDLLHLFGRIPASHFLTFCHAWKIPREIPVHSKAGEVLRESIRLWFSLRHRQPQLAKLPMLPCFTFVGGLLSQISSHLA